MNTTFIEDSLELYVIKRSGEKETVSFDKITKRLEDLCVARTIKCAYSLISKQTISGMFPGIRTNELDILASQQAAYMSMQSSEYGRLASALLVSNNHKETGTFSWTIKLLHKNGLLQPSVWDFFLEHEVELEALIDYNYDYNYDYSGINTMLTVPLLKIDGKVVERPQSMFMRQAVTFYTGQPNCMTHIKECYELFRDKKAIHGTPTSMHAGTTNELTSCFLQNLDGTQPKMKNIDTLYDVLKDTAAISYAAGGQSIAISSIPSSNGGILPFLKCVDTVSRHVKMLEGTRKSAISIYLEPWHADILSFIDLKLPSKLPEFTCKDLFIALWTSDLFMKRIEQKEQWSLFNPATAPGLDNCWGDEFDGLYVKYEKEGRAISTINAVVLWFNIIDNMIESGVPYFLFKDACNRTSNHQHRGCIKSSNLCTEIIQYTSPDETAVCNLASVSLPAFVTNIGGVSEFNHTALYNTVCTLVRNLDRVVDLSVFHSKKAILSNKLNRAIGIGDSGFADVCMMLLIPHTCVRARKLNLEISETIYYAFLRTSCDLARETGLTYPTYEGSFIHKGILNFDLHKHTPSNRWPFITLRHDIKQYGVRHSLGVCGMPTSTGSIILGNNESREPYISNLFVRGVLSGSYLVINHHLEEALKDIGLYTPHIKEQLLKADGSVQDILEIPAHIREVFRTVWEVPCGDLIDMAADAMIYTDQSRSMSLFFDKVTRERLSNALFYAWKRGLKTGMYYLRTKAPLKAPPMALNCLMCAT